jgi:hypothetical protein
VSVKEEKEEQKSCIALQIPVSPLFFLLILITYSLLQMRDISEKVDRDGVAKETNI